MGELVAVGSVVYNMAGDVESRPSYLKSLVIQNILSGTKTGIGQSLRDGYLRGPTIQLRQFYRWAQRSGNYDEVGVPTGNMGSTGYIDALLVEPYIPAGDGFVEALYASIGAGDILSFAEQWILENRPTDIDDAWIAELDIDTFTFSITFTDTSVETFIDTSFSFDAQYVYCAFLPYTVVDLENVYEDRQLFIYKIGSGTADLDELISANAIFDGFFPFIPFRINNKFLSESYYPDAWAQVKAAYKKATNSKIQNLIEQLKDNDNLDDIDHAYVVFGVSLNVIDNSCRKYLYNFFKQLQSMETLGQEEYESWDSSSRTSPTTNSIHISGSGDLRSRYKVFLEWYYIEEVTGTGVGKTGASKGEVWLEHTGTTEIIRHWVDKDGNPESKKLRDVHTMRIYWQTSESTYKYLKIVGCEYKNYIYKDNAVIIHTKKALQDTDESGFIVPIYFPVWSAMSLVDTSQMSTACIFAVFNAVEVKKTKWYQSGIFKIFLIIVIAIASVVFTGGAGFGLLGSHLAIGTTLGFTGLTAAIVGSVVNALAALVLVTILDATLGNLGIIGDILTAVVMIVVGSVASSFQSTGLLTMNWSSLLRVDNLLKLTDAVGRGLTGALQDDIAQMQTNFNNFMENQKRETAKIQQAYFNEFGYGAGIIDPSMFLDSSYGLIAESSDTFLTRTLMTGSDIAEMSRELLYEFPSLSLKLPNAFT